MFGQSAIAGFFGANIIKRGSYLILRARGADRARADMRSDEYASSACTAITTATAVATLDPVGFAGGSAYTALLEADLKKKKEGR